MTRLKVIRGMRSEAAQLTVAELRAMLAEAEAREQSECERLRAEVDRLRAERTPAPVDRTGDIPPVMNVIEAANVLRVSESTVRNYIKAGKLRAAQTAPGSRIMIFRDAVLALQR